MKFLSNIKLRFNRILEIGGLSFGDSTIGSPKAGDLHKKDNKLKYEGKIESEETSSIDSDGVLTTKSYVDEHTGDSDIHFEKSDVSKSDVGLSNVDNIKQTPYSHIGDAGDAHGVATTSTNGFMDSNDKVKINGIEENANNYTHPSTHPASMIEEDSSSRFVTDSQIDLWNNKTDLSLGSSSSDAHRADHGEIAYNHSQSTHAPSDAPSDSEFKSHTGDSTIHITFSEREEWNSKQDELGYTPEDIDNKGISNGYAGLDSNAKVPLSNLPDTTKQQTYVVSSISNRNDLSNLIQGDKCFVTQDGDSYIWDGESWEILAQAEWENVNLDWANINGKPSTATRWPSWTEVTSRPSTFTPSSHDNSAHSTNYTPESRSITAGDGLSGGGTFSSNRTIELGTPSSVTGSSSNIVSSTGHTHALSITKDDVGLGDVDNYSRSYYDDRYSFKKHEHEEYATIDYVDENAGGDIIPQTNTTTLSSESSAVDIGISGFNQDNHFLFVIANSVFLANGSDYTINNGKIEKVSGSWKAGTVFSFLSFSMGDLDLESSELPVRLEEKFIASEGQTTFNLTKGEYITNTNSIEIYVNGLKIQQSSFTETSSTKVTLSSGLQEGDQLIVKWYQLVGLKFAVPQVDNHVADGYFNNVHGIKDSIENVFAKVEHNHDSRYADINHNHDSDYQSKSQLIRNIHVSTEEPSESDGEEGDLWLIYEE